jgi:hypothetical protein
MARLNSILALLCLALSSEAQHISSGPIMRTIAAAGGASTLNTDLIAYWKLDEASGTRADSETTGTAQDLTDNNTVTSTTGKIGNAAQFTAANSEWLHRNDSTDLSTGNIDFTFAFWVYLDTKSANQVLVGKSGASVEFYCWYVNGSDRLEFRASQNGSSETAATANNHGSVSTSTWYFVVCWHNAASDTINISVNNGTVNSTGFNVAGVVDGTNPFQVGRYGAAGVYTNGRIDEVGFWKKVLTSDERTELYNAGSGKTCCPF